MATSPDALSKTDAAILGMLTIEPMSGYDMKKFCAQSLEHFWHENYGNLYPRLKRLASSGLIRPRKERRPSGPNAIVYSLTPTGRRRFKAWLQVDPEPEQQRSEFMLKVFFGAHAKPGLPAAWITAYRRRHEVIREQYASIERMLRAGLADRPEVPFWLMALRRGQLLTDARLRWCAECEAALQE